MVGLGGLEPPTSPLSGARSSHLSYRPGQASGETTHISFSLRCLSFVCNCVQILKLRWPRFFGHRWRSRAPNARSASGFSSIQIQYCELGGQFGNHCHLYGKRVSHPSGLFVASFCSLTVTRPSLSPNVMLRDSRCRLARGHGSPRIPTAAQGAIQSNQIGGDRRLTLYELIFVCVKIALSIQH